MQVVVRFNNVDVALRNLKRKMQREGIYKVMKLSRFHEKPSQVRVRKTQEAIRRRRKLDRKRFF
ncbi:30S ribosomal protein S21 [Rickettsiales endosymbiont of Peranema trichophorum]|uniref:30S ribosomal protein S21 n=1 Tax=Rickettsiales endosymbiont of Peranema trichophorum TaxID=2486577 RepID=UPI0010235A08|nr:30S ribosomal protein S21 [Rickettsiales endosymbiont of Peranema trichophorum]